MDVTVVIATHNRADELTGTLERLRALPERPPVIVVDNASGDGTVERVRASHPWVSVIALVRNLGAAGRNVGVRQASTPYVALSDDDSWWSAGALPRATALLDEHPDVGLVAAHILVGPNHRPDPTCLLMRDSRLPAMNGVPGARSSGFSPAPRSSAARRSWPRAASSHGWVSVPRKRCSRSTWLAPAGT